jgi:hypothetical protein
MSLTKEQQQLLEQYGDVFPSQGAVEAVMDDMGRRGRCDWQNAVMMAEKLRYIYPKIMETEYPELLAANGGVLPIDSSPDPADETWRYYRIDQQGRAAWIDDDGTFAPSNSMTLRQVDGRLAEFGHKWDLTIFDLERAAKHPNIALPMLKGKMAKRAHDEWKNWVWLFGDADKGMPGLCNHPNITHLLAPLNAGTTSRLWANKSDDEIFADVAAVIDRVPVDTKRSHYVAQVFLPLALVQACMRRFIAATAQGSVTLWDRIKANYAGDETGQGKVEFKILNECAPAYRLDPKTGTDTSGISGDFIMACPPSDPDVGAFVSARPFSQRPPQEVDLKVSTLTHEKIGGCKLQAPLAFVVMRFGTT